MRGSRPMAPEFRHIDEVYGFLREIIATRDTAEWLSIFTAADIPAAPMYSIDDILADEHLNSTGFFKKNKHPSEGEIFELAVPTSEWSESRPQLRRHAPQLGEAYGRGVARSRLYAAPN